LALERDLAGVHFLVRVSDHLYYKPKGNTDSSIVEMEIKDLFDEVNNALICIIQSQKEKERKVLTKSFETSAES